MYIDRSADCLIRVIACLTMCLWVLVCSGGVGGRRRGVVVLNLKNKGKVSCFSISLSSGWGTSYKEGILCSCRPVEIILIKITKIRRIKKAIFYLATLS